MKSGTTNTSGDGNSHSTSDKQFAAHQSHKGSSQTQESMKNSKMDEDYIRELNGRHKDNRAENF